MSRLTALLALLVVGVAGCERSQACSLVACLDGVVVSFTGLSAQASYDIDIASQVGTSANYASFMTCTIASTGAAGRQLACTSSDPNNVFGTSVQIQDDALRAIQITVESGSTRIAQQIFAVSYQSTEINGPGCGICTSASISMMLP